MAHDMLHIMHAPRAYDAPSVRRAEAEIFTRGRGFFRRVTSITFSYIHVTQRRTVLDQTRATRARFAPPRRDAKLGAGAGLARGARLIQRCNRNPYM